MAKTLFGWLAGIVLLALGAPSRAADPTGAILWSGADFKRLEKSLIPKMDATKGGSETVMTQQTRKIPVSKRSG